MKKWSFFFLLFATAVFAETKHIGFVSIKPSYFYPQDRVFRHLYKGGFLPIGELGFMLTQRCFLSAEVGYFHKKKNISSFDLDFASTVTLVPFSLYIGYMVVHGNCWDFYAKVGPNVASAKTHIAIPNLPSEEHKWTFGGSVGVGGKFYFCRGFFLEMFSCYLYDRKKIKNDGDHFSVYLGGLQVGGGIGYRF